MADHQILHIGGGAGSGAAGDRTGGLAGPVFISDAIGGAVDTASSELPDEHESEAVGGKRIRSSAIWSRSVARDTELDGFEFEAAALPPRVSAGAAVHFRGIAEFPREPVLLPSALSAGRAAGIGVPVVDPGTGKERS